MPQKRPIPGYPSNPETLGQQIRKVRMDRGLLQKEVAEIIGVTEDTITNWENDRCQPYYIYTDKIKSFLNLELVLA